MTMDAPTFQREQPADLWDEIMPLLEKHRLEIARYKDIPLGVDQEHYQKIHEMGLLRLFTVRIDGELIGYCCLIAHPNPHYTSSFQAHEDVLYIAPAYRKTGIGWRFMRHVDAELKAEGCQAVYRHVKTDHDHGPLLERMGYEAVDTIWAKRLDKE